MAIDYKLVPFGSKAVTKRIYIKGAMAMRAQNAGKVTWGEVVCFWGVNIKPIIDGDYFTWCFIDAEGNRHSGQCQHYERNDYSAS